MLFYVGSDIIGILEKPDDRNYSKISLVMHDLATAVFRGHHYVLIENFALSQNIIEKVLDSTLCAGVKECCKSINWSILNIVRRVVVVTMHNITQYSNQPDFANKELITYNPVVDNNLELYEETHLITEHFNDGHIMHAIGLRYAKECGLKNDNICFFNRNGGGTTIADVFEHELNLKNHFCLVIADNDKGHPKDPDGDTASKVKEKKNQTDWKHSEIYVFANVREVENLIPISILTKGLRKDIKPYNGKTLDFFDLKLGFNAKFFKKGKNYTYWKDVCGFGLPSINDIKNENDDKQIILGLGKNILTDFLYKKKMEN